MIVKIKRQDAPMQPPYWQTFSCEVSPDDTVARVLDVLNYTDDLFDIDGKPASRIAWSCSCMQGLCGGCAMVINGTPALACATFLRDLKGDTLVLEPLRKFLTVTDLIVSRDSLEDMLLEAQAYPGQTGEKAPGNEELLYTLSKCLRCGLCLEVCPNYVDHGRFFGAMFANEAYLDYTQTDARKNPLKKEYRKHFASGCSKSLSCMDVCPMELNTLASIAGMNRSR